MLYCTYSGLLQQVCFKLRGETRNVTLAAEVHLRPVVRSRKALPGTEMRESSTSDSKSL